MSRRLEIDLAALEANIARARELVAPAELMLVVKDDAYGHGVHRAVPRAHALGVRWIGAFDVRTAVAVRQCAVSDTRVFVWMLPTADEVARAVAHELDLGVGDAELLEDVAAAAASADAGPVRIHLKIDTGLRRNGIRPEEWAGVTARAHELERAGRVRVIGIWSHIAEASDAEDEAARAVFDRAVQDAADAGLRPELLHLSASAAGFARPEFRYDMVRVGAFCYGIAPAGGPEAQALGLRPISTLTADVISVTAGAVTVDIGMLDGLPSILTGRVSVGTPAGPRRVLSIGDVTRVTPWPGAAVGQQVRIYGPGEWGEQTATGLAETIGTIGEEIAVRLAPAIPRVETGTGTPSRFPADAGA